MDRHRQAYGVESICKVLQIAPSGYWRHAALKREPHRRCARVQRDETLIPHLQRVWHANLQVYGADKVWKQLLLVLTDGQPSDVDSPDERQLIEDTRRAVRELDRQGIYTHCISLDPNADAYVGDIFGQRHTVIDRVERLPERLPGLFLALTR